MKNNKTLLSVIIVIYILTFLAGIQNLNIEYLWFDEAGQFFISKGLNHDSNPLSSTNGLLSVIENNKYYNLDPGGFSILLHFWSYVSNYHIWLRLLPYLFFTGIVLCFIYLSYKWLANKILALLLGFIPFLTPVLLNVSFEVRAFSMEGLGTVISIVALESLKNKISYKNLFLWSCVFSFFMTSRYSEIIVIFVASVYTLYLILKSSSTFRDKLLSALIFSFPLLGTLIYIYFFSLIFQNKNIEPIFYLPYLSNNIHLLVTPKNLLFLGAIVLLFILYLLKNRFPIIKKYEILLSITISVNLLFIVLSYWGKYPWDPYSDRCISLFILALLSFSLIVGELIKQLFVGYENLKYYLILPVLILFLYLRKENLIQYDKSNFYNNFLKNNILSYNRIYVDRWESPSIRYLFEFGKLKANSNGYPDKFTFGKYLQHTSIANNPKSIQDFYKTQPKMNNYLDYDILITPELVEQGENDKWILIDGTKDFYIQKDNKNK